MNNKKILIYGTRSKKESTKIFVNDLDFLPPLWDQYRIPINVLKSIQNSFFDKKSFLESFGYDGVSLYWFIYPHLWSEIRVVTNFIDIFQKFVDKLDPKIIRVEDFSKFDIIKQISQKKKIKFEYSKASLTKFILRKKFGRYIRKYRLKKITKQKIKKKVNLFHKYHYPKFSIDNKIIFASSGIYRRDIVNLEKKVIEKGEYILEDIINLIKNKNKIICMDLDYEIRGDMKNYLERLNSTLFWLPIEIFLNDNKNHKIFFNKYEKLIHTQKFQEIFSFQDISLWKQLENIFEQMKFAPYIPLWLNLIDSLSELFLIQKPKSIFLLYETGPLALALITTCKKFKIKTLGLQHGIIGENHNYYSFEPIASLKNSYGFPLPDKLLLFGESTKKILLKNNYPSKNLEVFGNPSFFNLTEKNLILSKKSFYTKFKIDINQKVILHTTILLQGKNSWGKLDYDVQIWKNLLKNFSGNKDFFIILKPHPGENTEIYEEILNQFDSSNVKIIQGNVLEIINISSIMVSVYSSVIIDAVCMKKPVIEIKFDDTESPIPLENLGVSTTSNLENLSTKIYQIFENTQIIDDLLVNREKFLKEYYNLPEDKYKLENFLRENC